MIKIKRNPHLEDVEKYIINNSVNFKHLGFGAEGNIYYFRLNKKLILNTEILQPGEYVIKIFRTFMDYSPNQIRQYLSISKYGLIPKVFVITKKYIVMKYIKGQTLAKLYKTLSGDQYLDIRQRVNELSDIWYKLGFGELRDSNEENVLVSDDLKHVYIIDPFLD